MSTKRDMIKIETPEGLKLSVPAHVVATTFIAAALAQVGVHHPAAVPCQALNAGAVPALGEYWPGQGGHNGGWRAPQDGVPGHYLIVAAKDVGNHEWGGRGKESGATSKWDGLANTVTLCNSEDKHPAANACAEYQADGHHDFYLPAAAENYHCWLHVPTLFSQDCWYWSSSQRSAGSAFSMGFAVGFQDYGGKNGELRVRPVRRLFI